MPIIKAQKKSVRQSAKRRVFNDRRRRAMREAVKLIKTFVAGKDAKSANEALPSAYKAIDKAVKRGVIKKNTGSRKKSQLSRIIKEIA
jgi:small subunit ribosomal protein S20